MSARSNLQIQVHQLEFWQTSIPHIELSSCSWCIQCTKCDRWINLIAQCSNIQIQTLQTDLHTLPSRISWENLIKDQSIFPEVIILYILITFSCAYVLKLLRENRCWSLLGLRGQNNTPCTCISIFHSVAACWVVIVVWGTVLVHMYSSLLMNTNYTTVMKINKIITKGKMLWFFIKFSQLIL